MFGNFQVIGTPYLPSRFRQVEQHTTADMGILAHQNRDTPGNNYSGDTPGNHAKQHFNALDGYGWIDI